MRIDEETWMDSCYACGIEEPLCQLCEACTNCCNTPGHPPPTPKRTNPIAKIRAEMQAGTLPKDNIKLWAREMFGKR